jgi:hypothetical protein
MPASLRGALAPVALVAGLLAAPGCGADDGTAGGGPPATVREGPVAATAVVVGDCLNGIVLGAAERREISSARVVSCEREHGLEVYATFALDPADFELEAPAEYPGPARVVRAADEGCAERIQQIVDDPDAFGLIALWPSEESWAAGDRDVACAVFDPSGNAYGQPQL